MESLTAKEFRRLAWEKLAAHDGKTGYGTYLLGLLRQFAVLFCIGFAATFILVGALVAAGVLSEKGPVMMESMTLPQLSACLGVAAAATLLLYCMVAFARWGHKAMSIALVRGGLQASHALSGKGNVWRATSLMLWQHTYVFLWGLLLIVPGVRAFFSYMMAPYLLIDHPDWEPRRCLAESKRMMEGRRWRFFCLVASFAGWYLLVGFIGHCFGGLANWLLLPYPETAFAAFYEDLLDREDSETAEG